MTKILYLIEIAAFLFTLVLGFLWYQNPSGNYEPLLVISGAVIGLIIEIIRRLQTRYNQPPATSQPEATQKWILENSTSLDLSLLLPKVLLLGKMLKNEELEKWARLELNGYSSEYGMEEADVVPEYRTIQGQHTDEYGRPLIIDDPELHFFNETRLRFGVKELEESITKHNEVFVRDPNLRQLIRKYLKIDVTRFIFSSISIAGMLNRIRSELIQRMETLDISELQ